ncbi:MAG: hypothetical protein ACLP9L_34690 [Thermoguttaceae bacterium]
MIAWSTLLWAGSSGSGASAQQIATYLLTESLSTSTDFNTAGSLGAALKAYAGLLDSGQTAFTAAALANAPSSGGNNITSETTFTSSNP